MRPLPAIIDGQRTVVTGFYQDHHEKEWYIRAYAYLKERRTFIQKRFIECMRYVDMHSENTGHSPMNLPVFSEIAAGF